MPYAMDKDEEAWFAKLTKLLCRDAAAANTPMIDAVLSRIRLEVESTPSVAVLREHFDRMITLFDALALQPQSKQRNVGSGG